jgi:hypothetical protein
MPAPEPTNPPDEKSPIRFCATSAAIALLVYILSFGPAMWLVDRKIIPVWTKPTVSLVYYPIFWTSMVGPRPVRECVRWYAELGARRRIAPIFDDSSEAP